VQICAWTALGALFEGSIDADVAEGVVDGPEMAALLFAPPAAVVVAQRRRLDNRTVALPCSVCNRGRLRLLARTNAGVSLFTGLARGSGREGLVALLAGLESRPTQSYVGRQVHHNSA